MSHHVSCAFGGCGEGSWNLIVGFDRSHILKIFIKTLTTLNQSFFVSLFFFVSAYIVPSSYEKATASGNNWKAFQRSKRRRILYPEMLNMFVLSPFLVYICGDVNLYYPNTGVAWYLFWLLFFIVVYVSFRIVQNGDDTNKPTESLADPTVTTEEQLTRSNSKNEVVSTPLLCETEIETDSLETSLSERLILPTQQNDYNNAETVIPDGLDCEEATTRITTEPSLFFPSTRQRIFPGISICGLLLLLFVISIQGTFATMPVAMGSITCDFFIFYMGLQGKQKNGSKTVHP